jgi:small conductance mechanosensitive channel
VAGWARKGLRRMMTKNDVDAILIPFLSGLAYYTVLAIVVIAVLQLFGIQTASLVAVLGAAGLAVGLALQGTLSNFASGVMLLILRPFKVGDYVETAGTSGSVVEVGIFSTVLKSPDNIRITVPNSQVFSSTISNYNGFQTRRLSMIIGVSYDDDLSVAVDTISKIVHSDDRVLEDPVPEVAVSNLGDSSVDIVVRPWCASGDYWALRFDLTKRLKEELEAVGCSIPYPQRDVHLHPAAGSGA